MTILSKAFFFLILNSLKLSFKNIQGLPSNFVDCESFLELNSPDILALCETNLDDLIDYHNLSVRGYLPLIWKDSSAHMHFLTVYVKEGIPFAWDLSLENSVDSCFWAALLPSVSYSFFLYQSPSLSLCTVYSISSFMDEVLKLTDLLMCLSLKTLKDWFCKNTLSDIRFLLKNMKSTYFDYLKNISQFFWMFSIAYRNTFF